MNIARIFPASFSPSNFFRRLLRFGNSSDDNSAQTTRHILPFSSFSFDSLRRRLWSSDSSDNPNQTTTDQTHHSSTSFDAENRIQAMEMEAGSPAAADPQQDSKRMRKLVPTVSLAVAASCCGIFAGIPPAVQLDPHPPLFYHFLVAFVSLDVFMSLGLLVYSLVRPEGAWVQKNGVIVVVVIFMVAFVLRIALPSLLLSSRFGRSSPL